MVDQLSDPPDDGPDAAPLARTRRSREGDHPVVGRKASPALTAAWARAGTVTDRELMAFVPSPAVMAVAAAVVSGQATAQGISDASGIDRERLRVILHDPVAMAWISRATYAHFQHRVALVDAALYGRAVTGDVAAIKLFYDRMQKVVHERNVNVRVMGGVNVTALTDEELQRLVKDGNARLPKQVIDAEFAVADEGDPGAAVRGSGGAEAPDGGGPVPLLPAPPEGAQAPAEVPPGDL